MKLMQYTVFAISFFFAAVNSQQPGTVKPENHPPLPIQSCTKSGGCQTEQKSVVVDANWRWTHTVKGYTNCYTGESWDSIICPDDITCAKNCALDGADYQGTYGVATSGSSLRLAFYTHGRILRKNTNFLSSRTESLHSMLMIPSCPVESTVLSISLKWMLTAE